MDSGSNDRRVSPPSETAVGRSEGLGDSSVGSEAEKPAEGSPCFTERQLERELPPIPDWMRKPPPSSQPTLF